MVIESLTGGRRIVGILAEGNGAPRAAHNNLTDAGTMHRC